MRRSLLHFLAITLGIATRAAAQVPPDADWRTIRTEHFHVHFTPELEARARIAAGVAERAYGQLAAELHRPRGPIDLVLADNVDFVQGYATPFPTNRIVVYAHPPSEPRSIRASSDPLELVITHELVHIFHLDRARGLWRLGQYVLGRNPVLMPQTYAPAWITEGLAVYYESRLTGYGRLDGSEFLMDARAAELDGHQIGLSELDLSTTRFPGGDLAYGWGGMLLDHIARTRGDSAIPRFVERSSGALPFLLERPARRAFGTSFTAAWRGWRDSIARAVDSSAARGGPVPGWRELTSEGRFTLWPRWADTSTLVYASGGGREVTSAYSVTVSGTNRRLGRRNSVGPQVPLAGGGLLYSQLEYVDAYTIRSDLWVSRDGEDRRLTTAQRLTLPDARRDGEIVAVQARPGTLGLARVSADGRRVTPIAVADPETRWLDPSWSPSGDRIAAVRWMRGGWSEIVVLDTAGAVLEVLARDRAISASPAWSPDGRRLLYMSDRTGVMQAYAVERASATASARTLSAAATGFFHPVASPDDDRLAGIIYRADGYHVGVAPRQPAESLAVVGIARDSAGAVMPAAAPAAATATSYSPWRQLLPRYWLPLLSEEDDGRTQFGLLTSGEDIVGRHAWAASLLATNAPEVEWDASYRYSGFGMPLVDVAASQAFEHFGISDNNGTPVGILARRQRFGALGLTIARPRFRTYSFLSAGAGYEWRVFQSEEPAIVSGLPQLFERTFQYPSFFVSAGWSNTRRPSLAISSEDGVGVTVTARHRWRTDLPDSTHSNSVIGIGRGYKSLDLPGYAHHVLATRVALGWRDERSADAFEVGGVSGGSFSILPGVGVAGESRTFGVRGFHSATQAGIRAVAGTLEYRLPFFATSRGLGTLPFFLSRTSLTAFGDAGHAWCPEALTGRVVCAASDTTSQWLASAGAELGIDASIPYDRSYRFRLGVAMPVVGREEYGASTATVYFTVGLAY